MADASRDDDTRGRAGGDEPPRYEPPQLVVIGTAADLTQTHGHGPAHPPGPPFHIHVSGD